MWKLNSNKITNSSLDMQYDKYFHFYSLFLFIKEQENKLNEN